MLSPFFYAPWVKMRIRLNIIASHSKEKIYCNRELEGKGKLSQGHHQVYSLIEKTSLCPNNCKEEIQPC